MKRRRSQTALVIAGAVVIAGGVAIGLAELYRYPKGSVWVIVAATAALAFAIMKLSGR